jgi:hypothetical protein
MRIFLRSGPLHLMNASMPKSYKSSGFLIASACLLLLLCFGYRADFGLFARPITEANGWSREIISIARAVQNLIWGIIAFFAGGAGCTTVAAVTIWYGGRASLWV